VAFTAQKPSYRLLDPATAKREGGLVARYQVRFDPA
jgi:hypothetical protein